MINKIQYIMNLITKLHIIYLTVLQEFYFQLYIKYHPYIL